MTEMAVGNRQRDTKYKPPAFLYHEENFSSFFFMSGDVSATVFIK